MLYCDLTLNGELAWSGVPCLNGVAINSLPYVGFEGQLVFIDTMGYENPNYTGLSDRFILLYIVDGQDNQQVPLQDLPSQQTVIVLNEQNCVLAFYEREDPGGTQSVYVRVEAPQAAVITDVLAATAVPDIGTAYLWTLTNGTILSGQGTETITYQADSVGDVIISVLATLASGEQVTASAVTVVYDSAAFVIGAPEYVWAGQFGIPIFVAYAGAGFAWSASGGVRLETSATANAGTVNAGMASQPNELQATINGSVLGTWTFKIVPYTSQLNLETALLTDGASEQIIADFGWQWELVSVHASAACWVRVYATQADLDADSGRAVGDDPSTAIVWDGIFSGEGTITNDITTNPRVVGTNGDSPRSKSAYVSVTNLSGGDSQIYIEVVRTETQVGNTF